MKYSIVQEWIRLFDLWLFDIRDFSFFFKQYLNNSEHQQIKSYDFQFQGTSNFSK